MSFTERDENMEGLKLMGETNLIELFKARIEIMNNSTFVVALEEKKKATISFSENYISFNRLEKLFCNRRR